MSIKEWIESLAAAWPVLAALGTAAVGFFVGNDRSKRKIEALEKCYTDLAADLETHKVAAKKDADGIGTKVTILAGEGALAKQRCDRAKEDHEKLEREYRESQKELPEKLKEVRHEVIAHLTESINAINERHELLRDDVRDLQKGR